MKICFLGDGESIHILRWVEYFVNKGYEVHLITFSNLKDVEGLSGKNNFKFYKIGDISIKSGGNNWRYLLHLINIKILLNKIKPDIVNAHYVTSYGFLASILRVKKLVLSAWGSDILITPKKNFIYKCITKYALKRCQLVTSDSEHMSKVIEEYGQNKILTVPMGVAEKLCKLERKNNSNEITILSLRTINKNCNIDCIVKAFKTFRDKYSNAKLIITNSGSEFDNIKRLVGELGISNSVLFKGFITTNNLIELLLESDIYISIPSSDSTSVTLLEAMACGIIPVVSNIPANCEWIKNDDNGIIIDRIDADLLCKALLKASEDKLLKKRCMVKNPKIILHKAIWKNNMARVESKYLEITALI